jgi:cysteinyl-tRNA synthetase
MTSEAKPRFDKPLAKSPNGWMKLCRLVFLALPLLLATPLAGGSAAHAQSGKEQAKTPSPPPGGAILPPNYREYLRGIMLELSIYARKRDPKFLLLFRDGLSLMTKNKWENDLDDRLDPMGYEVDKRPPLGAFYRHMARAFDAVVEDGIWCQSKDPAQFTPDDEKNARLAVADAFTALTKRLITIDRCANPKMAADAYALSRRRGALPYVHSGQDDKLDRVPSGPAPEENAQHIPTIFEVRNFLPLLDTYRFGPKSRALMALSESNHDMLILDVFHGPTMESMTKKEVYDLKFKKLGAQRKLLARLPIGIADVGRFYWKSDWHEGSPDWILQPLPDNPDRYYVRYWDAAWKEILGKYLAGIMDLGFDGVMFDETGTWRIFEAAAPFE